MQILDPSGYPMMSREEVEIINNLLREKQCKRCLEWGSGNSTVFFPKENPFIEEWIAIEHNKTYSELLGNKLTEINSSIVVVPEGHYVSYPKTLNKKFDFILIDGLFRDACVEEAFNLVNKDGSILLHDAFRKESQNIIEKYEGKFEKLSEGEKLLSNGFYAHRGLILFKI